MQIEIKEIAFSDLADFMKRNGLQASSSEDKLHPQALVAGAFSDGRLCGVIICQREDREGERHFGTFRILDLFVLPEMRGNGISRLLLLRSAAYTKRYKGRYLWCLSSKELTPYFRKCGFYDELPENEELNNRIIFIRETESF